MLLAAVTQITGIIVAKTVTTIKATNVITANANTIVTMETINATITLIAKRRTTRKSPTRRKMTANTITSQRRTTRSCTTTTPHCQVWTLYPEKGVAPCQGLLLAHAPVLALAQTAAKGATQITMALMMTASQAAPSSASIHTWTTTTTDKSTIWRKATPFLPPLLLQKRRRKGVVPCRESCQQSNIFVSHLVSLFQIRNLIV
jgi:hypothetical protein